MANNTLPRKTVVKMESMSEAIAFLREQHAISNPGIQCHYTFNSTAEQAWHKALIGDASLVPLAEALMDEIESATYNIVDKTSISDVFGTSLKMGDYLAGNPICFRRHKKQSTLANIPANFYICVGFGGYVSAELTMKRGIAITALVAKLATIRPVNFYIIDENVTVHGMATTSVRLDTAPLNLAQIAYCVTSQAYVDAVLYSLARCHGHSIQWPSSKRMLPAKVYARQVLAQLGEDSPESSLYLSGVDNAEIANFHDPVKWVNEKLKLFAGLENEDGD
jgi:hypothetical protein